MGETTLAEYLRQARERAGLSQRQLAAQLGIHNSYLARLESGETSRPTAMLLQRIADVLELPAMELLGFIGVRATQELPELAPYLRAKYHLDEAAVRAVAEQVRKLTKKQ